MTYTALLTLLMVAGSNAQLGDEVCQSLSILGDKETTRGTAIGCFHYLRNAPQSVVPEQYKKKIEDDLAVEVKKCACGFADGSVTVGDVGGILETLGSIFGGGEQANKLAQVIRTAAGFTKMGGEVFTGTSTANINQCRKKMRDAICEELMREFPDRQAACSSVKWCNIYSMAYNKEDLLDYVAGPRPNVALKFGKTEALCTGSRTDAQVKALTRGAIIRGLAQMRRPRVNDIANVPTIGSQALQRWFKDLTAVPNMFAACKR